MRSHTDLFFSGKDSRLLRVGTRFHFFRPWLTFPVEGIRRGKKWPSKATYDQCLPFFRGLRRALSKSRACLGMFFAYFCDIRQPTGDEKRAVGRIILEKTYKGIDT
jgi:hypothetical protein